MSKWVTSWGVPTSYVVEGIGNLFDDTTFRNVFYNPIKGERVRIRFSNLYGKEDVKLDAVSIAEWTGKGPSIKPETLVRIPLQKCGNVIKAGCELVTDEVDFVLEPKKNYVVSYYFKDITRIATGYTKFSGDKLAPCWLGRGNFVDAEEVDLHKRRETQGYAFFCGVDVLSDDDTHSVMAFGDSITARPWPDFLVRRINNEGYTNRSVVRKAIGGNRILRDYRNVLPRRNQGISAIERFEMSIKQVQGVDKVIMLEGINDIYHPHPDSLFCGLDELPTAEEMIEGYKLCCNIAHKYGAKIYLCTILPTAHLNNHGFGKEDIRLKVNGWIRNNDVADGFIDFDKTMADSEHPDLMKAEYDCGDTLHPNDDGSMALCNTVPDHIYKD
ncbi:MAG: hypothetical protein E7615_07490 [Ruminococcaceae bacterium]|nr:hypothetical protein [Oscillospiraceae bacterium]